MAQQAQAQEMRAWLKRALAQAKEAHRAQKEWVRQMAERAARGEAIAPSDPTRCGFGRWLYGVGRRLQIYPEYHELEALHDQLHMYQVQLSAQADAAEALIPAMRTAAEAMDAVLVRLVRRAVAALRRSQLSPTPPQEAVFAHAAWIDEVQGWLFGARPEAAEPPVCPLEVWLNEARIRWGDDPRMKALASAHEAWHRQFAEAWRAAHAGDEPRLKTAAKLLKEAHGAWLAALHAWEAKPPL